jgi:hypothetical protein
MPIDDAQSQEIENLKAEIDRLLVKHAREQDVALSVIERATNEIVRLKTVIEEKREVSATSTQVEAYETAIRELTEHNKAKNQIIRELMAWLDEEFNLQTWSTNSPGRKLWNRALEAIQ